MSDARIGWVDYAKGICIILVVMMHAVHRVEADLGATGILSPVVTFAQSFRMPDFFMISGLFLSRSINGPLSDYMDRKFVHFLYFYVLWHAIQHAAFETSLLVSSPIEFVRMWFFGFIEPSSTLWFVHMLLIFYIVTRLVRRVPVWLVFGAALALQSVYHLGLTDTGWTVPDRFSDRYVYFFAGYAFAPAIFAFAQRAATSVPVALAGLGVWGVINQFGVSHNLHLQAGASFLLGIMGATAICTIAALLVRFDWAKVLRYCGRNSIVIYLTFALPLTVMLKVIAAAKLGPGMVDLATIATLAVSVISPLVFHRLIQKTPLRALYDRPGWARLKPVSRDPAAGPTPA